MYEHRIQQGVSTNVFGALLQTTGSLDVTNANKGCNKLDKLKLKL